jgi:hypothetical protein
LSRATAFNKKYRGIFFGYEQAVQSPVTRDKVYYLHETGILTAVPAQNVVAKQVTGQIVQAVSGE